MESLLDRVNSPADLRALSYAELDQLCAEIRTFLVDTVDGIGGGGHLASNLGVVELFGRAGVAETRVRFEGLGSGSASGFSYGGGLRLLPTDNLTLSVDYMNYLDKDGVTIDGYTFSVGLKF